MNKNEICIRCGTDYKEMTKELLVLDVYKRQVFDEEDVKKNEQSV